MRDVIQARLRQLQTERQPLAARRQQLGKGLERGRFTVASYDGAIGELSALLATPPHTDGAHDAPEGAAE